MFKDKKNLKIIILQNFLKISRVKKKALIRRQIKKVKLN